MNIKIEGDPQFNETFLASKMKSDSFAIIVSFACNPLIVGKVLYRSLHSKMDSMYDTGLFVLGTGTWINDRNTCTVRKLRKGEKIVISEE